MKTLYQFKALGRSYRIVSCIENLTTRFYIEFYINRNWRRLSNSAFFTFEDAVNDLSYRIAGRIRYTAKLSPLS